ncbi:uncharacterized protein LOC122850880 [Aphidius gifuensis]|uniref:uncharacterized protein LOC122850880 n=1 Tax=Aphidius gifuensis TaxID=684658 RepID=UPI001CDD8A18|nr:uncharacterized protein LOC122850880 [Aphidius gifuensis]
MELICHHCGAKHFKAEDISNKKTSFSSCCSHGEIMIDPMPEPPLLLKINYNNKPGPYCFKIQGQIYYQINTSLYPSAEESPSFEIIDAIETVLRQHNVFAQSYQMMHEELRQAMIDKDVDTEPEMQLLFSLKPGLDIRRYNPQRVNEVAAVFTTTADGDIPESYVTIHNKRTKTLQYLSSMDPNVEALVYPLYYPYGTNSWSSTLTKVNKQKRISRAAYIKHRIAIRDTDNIFLMGGRLFQQWLVDNFITTTVSVDKFIAAEIPNPSDDQILHKIVMKNMIHGPCGDWCKNKDGICTKHFPKKFQNETLIDENGYPTYKRRNTGVYKRINGEAVDNRYVSAVEACDRILGRSLQKKSHSIIRLPIHLPNQQNVIINNDDADTLRAALQKNTMLLEYFALNQRDENAKEYLYADIPSHYVFKNLSGTKSWEIRKQQHNVIGRMYAVSPHQMELFNLRLLLLTVKGATSYENLRTINGKIYDTYHAACLSLGLIEDDTEWERAMTEGEIWMMPRQLRRLFVSILIHCQPNDPGKLWEKFKDALSQDFYKSSTSESIKKAYHEINALLCNDKHILDDFPTMPSLSEFEIVENIEDNIEEIDPSHHEIGESQYKKLNVKQKEIVDRIIEVVMMGDEKNNSETCYYIDGPGGSGKTFVYITLYHLLKSKGKKVCTMSFTGVSAILLPNGKTVHKTFGLPVPLFPDSTSHIKIQSKEAHIMKNYDLIIWDEGPMAPRYCMEIGDMTYKYFMNNDLPFGGKVILIGGDFRQLLPVKVNATQNMRTLPEEKEFSKYLLDVGNGVLNDKNDNIIAPEQCIAENNEDIVESIFKEIIKNQKYDELTKVAVLAARNVDVDEINCKVLKLFDKKTEKIYPSIDSTENCDNGDIKDAILPEYLHSLNPSNFPQHELKLRINCVVMLLRNLSIAEGLCNGTRLQILELANNLLKFNSS